MLPFTIAKFSMGLQEISKQFPPLNCNSIQISEKKTHFFDYICLLSPSAAVIHGLWCLVITPSVDDDEHYDGYDDNNKNSSLDSRDIELWKKKDISDFSMSGKLYSSGSNGIFSSSSTSYLSVNGKL